MNQISLMLSLFVLLAATATIASDLVAIPNCQLLETEWADGDSFLVQTPGGDEHTIRLYGVDCLEWHVTDESDARRLRAQRRYFGITDVEKSSAESIQVAKGYGELAWTEVRQALAKPFTIHTAYADARGDGKYQRIYAFVVLENGKDLAEHLVRRGLARAFGVSRQPYDERSRDEFQTHLKDVELLAARSGVGVWAKTDWESLLDERMTQRLEDEELKLATARPTLKKDETLDPNTAPRDALMKLPGVGEILANRIIEGRPYQSVEDLMQVSGIGANTLEKIRHHLKTPSNP
ncbi:helix-hairpin-helix domain-containing protein [Verrucomicrobiales bacterium]|nr:helix-hairpin-helix domain-containing protein [Verrucomicrobiales bacterium]MDB3941377.1 helix-hairpin-helix domain-containing protein [Verrucomicrobiales bacterium]MDC3352848.1 helix-hairpin-helix domain-containing protein [Verrucomicrobiales bacterium]